MKDCEKLKAFREREGLSQAKLAKKLQISQTLITMYESGERNLSPRFKLAFKNAYGIDWDTQIASKDTFDYDLLQPQRTTRVSANVVQIPFYSAKAAAGSGAPLTDYLEKDCIYFDKRWLQTIVGRNTEHLSLITAEGESMSPTINNGDLLMIDDSIREYLPNKIFVIVQDSELRVKRLKAELDGSILIISDNPTFPMEVMNKETTIIGQVVWNGSKESL